MLSGAPVANNISYGYEMNVEEIEWNDTIKARSVEMLTYCDIGMMVCVDYKGREWHKICPPLYLSGPILTCGPIFKSDPILRKQTQAQVRDLMNRERRDCSFCSHFMVYLLWFDLSGRRPCFLCSPICPPPDMGRGLKLELASS